MYIGEIISPFYADVSLLDSVHTALNRINEHHLHQLPVVDKGEFVGLIREEDLLSVEDDSLLIKDIKTTSSFIYLYDYQHIYDGLQMMTTYGHDVLPVVDKAHKYMGIVTAKNILEALNVTLANNEPGATIVLELDIRDNALSHVAHIIESENTKILSTASRQIPDSNKIEMTIKVNKSNISAVVASLWRFDYVVKATFNDGSDQNDIQDRYNLLMNYLDI